MSVSRQMFPGSRRGQMRGPATVLALACVLLMSLSHGVRAADDDDDDDDRKSAKKTSQIPNIYLDMRTNYVTVPSGTLAIGFGNSLALSSLSALSSASGQGLGVDLPLTIDLTDRFSVFGGITASTSRTDISSWTPLTVASWNIGFQADVYEQKGGQFPTVTILSTLTKSATDSPLATTSTQTIVEFSYALNKDETKGLLAGSQITTVSVDSGLASVSPAVIGYVGAYYQWSNNWKLTGRAGIQSFGGGNTSALAPFLPSGQSLLSLSSFTQPVLRADIEKVDDNDNRLFGVTGAVYWTPKPAFQFILRTPIYFVRN